YQKKLNKMKDKISTQSRNPHETDLHSGNHIPAHGNDFDNQERGRVKAKPDHPELDLPTIQWSEGHEPKGDGIHPVAVVQKDVYGLSPDFSGSMKTPIDPIATATLQHLGFMPETTQSFNYQDVNNLVAKH